MSNYIYTNGELINADRLVHSRSNVASRVNTHINWQDSLPSDIRSYAVELNRLGIPIDKTFDVEILRTLKSAGYTPQDVINMIITGDPKKVPNAVRKMMNVYYSASKNSQK